MPTSDHLHLQGLSITTNIGVPNEERAVPQRLKLNVTLWPSGPLAGLGDDFARTIDYAAVAIQLRQCATERPRLLIETLADDLIDRLFALFPLDQVRLEIQKFILPDTDYVSVCMTKSRPPL